MMPKRKRLKNNLLPGMINTYPLAVQQKIATLQGEQITDTAPSSAPTATPPAVTEAMPTAQTLSGQSSAPISQSAGSWLRPSTPFTANPALIIILIVIIVIIVLVVRAGGLKQTIIKIENA